MKELNRKIFFEANQAVSAAVYDRVDLKAGQRVYGPAVIEQLDTTTLIYPTDFADVSADGHLIIHIQLW